MACSVVFCGLVAALCFVLHRKKQKSIAAGLEVPDDEATCETVMSDANECNMTADGAETVRIV